MLAADDPALMAVYRMCVEANRRVILSFEDAHPPETCSISEFFAQLDGVLSELPDLMVQLNHAGCIDPLTPDIETAIRVIGRHQNALLSTAMMGLIWDDGTEYPFPNYLRRLEKLKDSVGVEKMMWGTDWPHLAHQMHYPQAVDAVRLHASFMSENEKAQFLGGNAMRFIGDAPVAANRARKPA